jgi:hypothetical protein
MAKQVLNVDIQPIVLDMNEIIEAHINRSVTEFNIKYLTQELKDHKEKVRTIEAQLAGLRSGHISSVVNVSDNDLVSEDSNNIQLVIDEPPLVTPVNNTTKVISLDPSIPKEIEFVNETNNINSGNNSLCFTTKSKDIEVAVPPIYSNEKSQENSKIDFNAYKATKSLQVNSDGPNEADSPENDGSEEEVTFEEEGVFEIEVDGITYFTNDETNGDLYEVDENGDPGDKIGVLENGEAVFS